MSLRGLLAALLVLAGASPALAGEAMAITRWDLARSLLSFERALADRDPPGEQRVALNRAFDRATAAFFLGRRAEAIREIDRMTETLRGLPRVAVKVRIEPPVVAAGREAAPVLRHAPIGDRAGTGPVALEFLDAGGRVAAEIELPAGSGALPLPPSALALPPGDYDVRAERQGAFPTVVGRYSVLPRPAGELAREAIGRLEDPELPPELRALAGIAAARARLLAEPVSEARGVMLVTPPFRLAREVSREVAAIGSGENPYRRRTGEIWRVLDPDGAAVPWRLHAPAAAAGDEPLPVVIALHGAGGDENLFLRGYGNGLLGDLADERGFLVACPATVRFSTDPAVFDALLAELSRDYAVDTDRVSIVGHSLGAGAAAILARARPDRIAAVALIAGGPSPARLPVPAIRVTGGLDLLARGPRVGPGIRFYPEEGHTLVVARALPEVVGFLLDPSPEEDD